MSIILTIIIVTTLYLLHKWWQALEFNGDVSPKTRERSMRRRR